MIKDKTLLEDQPVSNKILIVSNDKDGENALWYTPHYRITEDEITKELELCAYSNVDSKSIVIMCDVEGDYILDNEKAYYIDKVAEVLNDIGTEMKIERDNIDFRNDTKCKWLSITLQYFVTTAFDQYAKKDNDKLEAFIPVNVQYKNRAAMVPSRLLLRNAFGKDMEEMKNSCHYFVDNSGIYKCLPECYKVDYKIVNAYDTDMSIGSIIVNYTDEAKNKARKLAAYLANVYGLENPYA